MKITLTHEECLRSVFEYDSDKLINQTDPSPDQQLGSTYKTNEETIDFSSHRSNRSCISCILNRIRNAHAQFYGRSTPESLRNFYCFCKMPRHSKKSYSIFSFRTIFIFCLLLTLIASFYFSRKVLQSYFQDEQTRSQQSMTTHRYEKEQPVATVAMTSINKRRHKKRRASLGHPFNPEKWSNETANTRQRYLILYWSKVRGHKARIQKKTEYEKDNHVWPYTYAGDGTCPVSCELTNDRSRAAEASAFVVHSRLTDVWDFPPLEHLAPWILQNNENPVYTPALSDPQIMNKFNLLISYRLDSDFPSPIYPMPTTSKPIPFDERLGNVLAVFSKCEHVRTEYMRQLMRFIDVHSYGSCLKNKEGLIGLYGQVNGRYVFKDYKVVLTRFYKFSLVFMNQDCPYFVDDRLYHALETGSIPVYMGTDKIYEFLPGNLKDSIIKVSDFDSPKQLAEYLHYLSSNETAYNEYLAWKTTGIGDMSNTTIGRWWKQKYPLFCQVCMRLSQGNLHPGLDVDTCKPREYLDWNLYPPYGVDNSVADRTAAMTSGEKRRIFSYPDGYNTYTMLLICSSTLMLVATCMIFVTRLWNFLHRF